MKKAYCLGTALVCLLTTGAWAQQASQSVPLDRTGVERTHVPHENPNMWGAKSPNGSARPGGGGGGGGGTPNNPRATFSGSKYSVDLPVDATTTRPEAEEHIAGHPSGLVAAISDFSLRGGYNTTKFAWSNDGASWNEAFVPLNGQNRPITSDNLTNGWDANSDPVVAIDNSGIVYLANLYFNATNGNNANGLYVSVDDLSGGVSFSASATPPVAANLSSSTNTDEDKEWIAVDNSVASGNVYACWTRFVGNFDSIVFSRSTDHGQSWSSPALRISPSSQDGAVQGCQVAVGPGGEVYVTYEVYYVGSQRRHFMAKSINAKDPNQIVSFFDPTTGTPNSAGPITPLFNELSFNSTYRKNSFSALAVGPNGYVYVVYADQPSKTAGAEIEFIRSTNGGTSFTSPVAINENYSGQQFFPAVATDSNGKLHVSWFDTRNASGSTSKYDIYATSTDNGGSTFTPNARVTPALINAGSASFIGDYSGNAAVVLSGVSTAHPVWTSGGFNGGVLQTSTLQ